MAGRDEDHGVAGTDDDGAVGLLGELAGFERNRARTNLDLAPLEIDVVHRSVRALLADAETLDQARVPIRVFALQVIEKSTSLADQFQQPTA